MSSRGLTLLSLVLVAAAALFGAPAASGQQPSDAAAQTAPDASQPNSGSAAPSSLQSSYTIQVDGSRQWVDTKIDVRGGTKLKITAEGTITYSNKRKTFGPEGITRGFADLIHDYAVPSGAHGELIGRLGSTGVVEPFEVGNGTTYIAPIAERLFLGINQSMRDASEAEGEFRVRVEVVEQGSDAAIGGPAEASLPEITAALLESVPRRVSDPQHNPGYMVNVLLVGREDDVVKVFTTAGWVKVDKSVENTLMAGLKDTFEKKDYLTMPMSTLYLFDRPQDYGFAHAEPVRVVMSRNHLRVWKSPYEVKGLPLWCVAATHDIGFERDQRNNGLTHKIDPAIDGEREYVNQTLSGTGLVRARAHVSPPQPLTTAKTATGGEFHSDGRILVLVLKNGESER
ncbi:MAG: LssY C-terminal domain-containing protein [Terriglobales bacterium]